MSIIYKHTFKTSGKSYIGQTVKSMETRLSEHCNSARKNSSTHFHNAIRKYGRDDIVSTKLEEVSIETSSSREQYWIKYYDTFNNGYNMTIGGDGNIQPSTELKTLWSDVKKGTKNNFYGKKHSKESLQLISDSSKGRKANSQNINIYNKVDKLVFACFGDFKEVCIENNLPFISLKRSYQNEGTPIYNTSIGKTTAKTKGNEMYIGWYALKSPTS